MSRSKTTSSRHPASARSQPERSRRPVYKKGLGQHHLVDGQLCRPLLDFLAPRGRRVVEIGPGGGVLTAELAASGARVLALELDLPWACELQSRLRASRVGKHRPEPHRPVPHRSEPHSAGPHSIEPHSIEPHNAEPGTVTTVVLDALAMPWERLPASTLVTGNLPFNVATRLIEDILTWWQRIPQAAFMVQKEVGERLVACPGDKAYGALSVLVAARARASWLGTVRPGSFRPPPKVSAAFIGLDLHAPPLSEDEMPAFVRLVRAAFAQRRKTLRNSLGSQLGRPLAEASLRVAGIDGSCRAETLGLEAMLALHRAHLQAAREHS